MPSYRWAGSHAYRDHRNGRTIEPGDLIGQGVERIAAAHPQDVERVDAGTGADEYTDGPQSPHDVVAEYTVDELREYVADLPDIPTLRALREAEANQQHRTTALEAINTRIDELED